MKYNGKEYELVIVPKNPIDENQDCAGCVFDHEKSWKTTSGCDYMLKHDSQCGPINDGHGSRKVWKESE